MPHKSQIGADSSCLGRRKESGSKRSYGLPANHQWTARPGNKVFVADRGKAIFEVPGDWTISPNPDGGGSIRFFDKPKEADADIRLEFSIIYPPLRYPDTGLPIDWSGLPLDQADRRQRSWPETPGESRTGGSSSIRGGTTLKWPGWK